LELVGAPKIASTSAFDMSVEMRSRLAWVRVGAGTGGASGAVVVVVVLVTVVPSGDTAVVVVLCAGLQPVRAAIATMSGMTFFI